MEIRSVTMIILKMLKQTKLSHRFNKYRKLDNLNTKYWDFYFDIA